MVEKKGICRKCIGIIGGISWESTAHYYSSLNQGVKERLGGLHSAGILLWSVDFAEIEALQRAGDWERAGEIFADIARRLERGGAECMLIAANTMHKVADYVKNAVSIPLIHIGDATAKAVLASGTKRVLLLGTRYTMEQPFLKEYLANLGLNIVVPETDDILSVNRIIYEELCLGRVIDSSRDFLLNIISRNKERGIEGVILGCTELAMILEPQHVDLPLFDTTAIHVESALNFSIEI
jgi:aspartate racemase